MVNSTTANGPMFEGAFRRFVRANFRNKSIDIGEVLPEYVTQIFIANHLPK